MIALLSRWKLKSGYPAEFAAAVDELVTSVKSAEPGTLMYSVNHPASNPPIGPPPEYEVCNDPDLVAPPNENELVFFEVYQDAEAFSAHLRGPFNAFIVKNRGFFDTPWQGHPRPETTFLDPRSMFVRAALTNGDRG